MDLSWKNLNSLENLEQFAKLDENIKDVVIKHFFDFKSDFNVIVVERAFLTDSEIWIENQRIIFCRKCLNAELINQSTEGMIEHYLAHTLDNLSKLGLYNKRPMQLHLGG
jgi:hypothetical protein